MSNAPSWDATYSLIKSQKAKYAKGRSYENENLYTNWYGLNGEPFCFMFISWVLAHAGESESAGLALIEGKKAYVPYIRNIKGYHAGHSGVKVGAIAAVNGFNHIGFVTKVNSNGTFELYSGNTTYEGSDDAVWPKTYSLSYISGYVNLAYGSSSAKEEEDDFMSEYVSIDKVTTGAGKSRIEELTPGTWTQVYFNKNNSADAKKHHSAGDFPSLITTKGSGYYYTGHLSLRITGLPKGVEGQIRAIYVDGKTNAVQSYCDIDEFDGSDGDTFIKTPVDGYVPTGQKLRVELVVYGAGDTKPRVVAGQVRLHAKEA
jgi:hypothetical protein